MKQFELRHRFFDGRPSQFSEHDAPDWLTGVKTVPGSTIDNRWFWHDHVLTLQIGESIQTDFQTIRRIT